MAELQPGQDAPTDATGEDRQFVTALERGLRVLRAFSRKPGGLSNGELAKQTRLAPSTISRLVHTLRALGYLTYEGSTRSYVLTPQVLTLGYPVLAHAPLLQQVRPILNRLAERTGQTAAFAQRDGLHATFLDCVQGHDMLAVRLEVGARLPLATSAAGLCLMKAMPDKTRRALAARVRARLAHRDIAPGPFDARLRDAVEARVVIVRDTWHKGIGGAAVPIVNHAEIGAIVIPIATGRVSEEEMRGPLSATLLELAAPYLPMP